MLHEPASTPNYTPPYPPQDDFSQADKYLRNLQALIEQVMIIERQFVANRDSLPIEDLALLQKGSGDLIMSYAGTLKQPAEIAYEQLDTHLSHQQLMALFRNNPSSDKGAPHIIHIMAGRIDPPSPKGVPWLNIILFIATIISVLITGTIIAIGEIGLENEFQATVIARNFWQEIWRGWPYALGIMLILVAHEGGHYIMMRRHKVNGSLPYFIPMPFVSPFGTFGAAIILRGPIRNRKQLLDIGASGPLAGLIIAIPILLIGLATSPVIRIFGGLTEGNSILYALAKITIFGRFLPAGGEDVIVNQLAWAGWTGLFVTALNLIPIGQLDGGHVIYSLLGDKARRLYYPLMGAILTLILVVDDAWLLLFVLLFLVGRVYAVPLDNITLLDPTRKRIAFIAIIVFVLTFVPTPMSAAGDTGGLLVNLLYITAAIISAWQHRR